MLEKTEHAEAARYDAAFLACHSDQALALLADPSPTERAVLGALPYVENEAVLYTDSRLLPRRTLAHAAWNYHIATLPQRCVAVTYDMNRLQGLTSPERFLVTLNRTGDIAPERILRGTRYSHPLFTPASLAAQLKLVEINGPLRTNYCGANWRNGFHEDGIASAHAEITNTPWKERHAYPLSPPRNLGRGAIKRYRFDKRFHISPFINVRVTHAWRFSPPGETLDVHMRDLHNETVLFDATRRRNRRRSKPLNPRAPITLPQAC